MPPTQVIEAAGVYTIAEGVVVHDITSEIPTGDRAYKTRDPQNIERIYIHHSGRLGKPGKQGAVNTARYVVNHRGWPGAAYHFWLPYEEESDGDNLVIFQLQQLSTVCYHTGGVCNQHGIGIALQGNTSTIGMSHAQEESLEALIPYLAESCGLNYWDIAGHFEAKRFGGPRNKPSCPGKAARKWLEQYRRMAGDSPYQPD